MKIAEINKDECLLIGHLQHPNAFIFRLRKSLIGEGGKKYKYLIAFYKKLKIAKKELICKVLNAEQLSQIQKSMLPKGQCAVRRDEENKKKGPKTDRGIYRGDDVGAGAWEKVKTKDTIAPSYNGGELAGLRGPVYVAKTQLDDWKDNCPCGVGLEPDQDDGVASGHVASHVPGRVNGVSETGGDAVTAEGVRSGTEDFFAKIKRDFSAWRDRWERLKDQRMSVGAWLNELAQFGAGLTATGVNWPFVAEFNEWVRSTQEYVYHNGIPVYGDHPLRGDRIAATHRYLHGVLTKGKNEIRDAAERSAYDLVGVTMGVGLNRTATCARGAGDPSVAKRWGAVSRRFAGWKKKCESMRADNAEVRLWVSELSGLCQELSDSKLGWTFVRGFISWARVQNLDPNVDGSNWPSLDSVSRIMDKVGNAFREGSYDIRVEAEHAAYTCVGDVVKMGLVGYYVGLKAGASDDNDKYWEWIADECGGWKTRWRNGDWGMYELGDRLNDLLRFCSWLLRTSAQRWRFVKMLQSAGYGATGCIGANCYVDKNGNPLSSSLDVGEMRRITEFVYRDGLMSVWDPSERSAYEAVGEVVTLGFDKLSDHLRETAAAEERWAEFVRALDGWIQQRPGPDSCRSWLKYVEELCHYVHDNGGQWEFVRMCGTWAGGLLGDGSYSGYSRVTAVDVKSHARSVRSLYYDDRFKVRVHAEYRAREHVGAIVDNALDSLTKFCRERERSLTEDGGRVFVERFDAFLDALKPARDSYDWFADDRMEQLNRLVGYLERMELTWPFIPLLKKWVNDNWGTTWYGYFRLKEDAIRGPLRDVVDALAAGEQSVKGEAELSAYKHVGEVVKSKLEELAAFVGENKEWKVADGWDSFVKEFDAWLTKQAAPTTVQDRLRRMECLGDYLEHGGIEWPFMELLSSWVFGVNNDDDGTELKQDAVKTRTADILRSCDDGEKTVTDEAELAAYKHVCEVVKNELDAMLEYVIADEDDQNWSAPDDAEEDDDEQEWDAPDDDDDDDE